jgi:hypothetical protein
MATSSKSTSAMEIAKAKNQLRGVRLLSTIWLIFSVTDP